MSDVLCDGPSGLEATSWLFFLLPFVTDVGLLLVRVPISSLSLSPASGLSYRAPVMGMNDHPAPRHQEITSLEHNEPLP